MRRKLRSEMTPAELDAVREYDRIYWHTKRKTDPVYMEFKRRTDRERMKTWYPDNKEVQAERVRASKAKRTSINGDRTSGQNNHHQRGESV